MRSGFLIWPFLSEGFVGWRKKIVFSKAKDHSRLGVFWRPSPTAAHGWAIDVPPSPNGSLFAGYHVGPIAVSCWRLPASSKILKPIKLAQKECRSNCVAVWLAKTVFEGSRSSQTDPHRALTVGANRLGLGIESRSMEGPESRRSRSNSSSHRLWIHHARSSHYGADIYNYIESHLRSFEPFGPTRRHLLSFGGKLIPC